MKNKLTLLLLSPMIISLAGCGNHNTTPQQKVDVVIISGQSNGVGCTWSNQIPGSMGMDKFNEYSAGYSTIKIAHDCWTKDWPAGGVTYYPQNTSTGFVPVKLGQGNGKHSFGPEIGIAEQCHEKYADKLFLIKFACGGSNLKDDWLDKENSPMYPKFVAYVREQIDALKKMGFDPTIKAFCWMQGEGDSYQGYYKQYKANLRTFVGNVREDFKEYEGEHIIPFIDAGISSYHEWVYFAQVNQAKEEFAAESEYNFYIDSLKEGLHTHLEPIGNVDGAHWDSESEIKLGHLFADKFEQFLMQPEETTK